jgi:dTDP-4-dehydrorhamnose reductase
VRTSAFFGPWDEHNFVARLIKSATRQQKFLAPSDQIITPTYVPDLVNNCLDLIIDQANGIWHITNASATTWSDFAFSALEIAGLDRNLIKPVASATSNLCARRPANSALQSEKGMVLPTLADAISRFFREVNVD